MTGSFEQKERLSSFFRKNAAGSLSVLSEKHHGWGGTEGGLGVQGQLSVRKGDAGNPAAL